ncbi:MAG: hypothetical protein JXA11_02470 [Phycisphaerae bacterium]|nr:hypothetical protein [Phycisphaerae bacterium]
MRSFLDVKKGCEFIASGAPLYRMQLSKRGGETMELTSLDAKDCKVEQKSDTGCQTITLTFGRHGSHDLRVVCTVVLEEKSPICRWRISVKNNTSHGIRAVFYPIVQTPLTLGKANQEDCFVWPRLGGMIIKDPSINSAGFSVREQYPGKISAQLQMLYNKTAGLYLATYDDQGNIKHYGMRRLKDSLDVSLEHNYDETPGLDFSLPYDTVLGVFHGDWHDGADLYKAWGTQQHWCSKTLARRKDIPGWAKQGRPYLMFMQTGHQGTLWYGPLRTAAELPNSRYFPSKKLAPLMKQYSTSLKTPVIPLWIAWQKWGDCIGPDDMFPDGKGGIKPETWKEFKASLTQMWRQDAPALLMIPGLHWTYRKDSTGYNSWDRFAKEGKQLASLGDKGNIRFAVWPMKTFAHLCHGSADVRRMFLKIVDKMLDAGIPIIQYDVFHGGQPHVPCYSTKHGHKPGYGQWMYKTSLDLLHKSRQRIKKHNPEFTLSIETPCETLLQELDVAMYRPNVGIPLYSYLYHEYFVGFGGEDETDFSHPEQESIKLAMVVRDGVSFLTVIGKPEFDLDAKPPHPAMKLLENACRAMRTYANEYLVFGRMRKPTRLDVATTTVPLFSQSGSSGPKGPQGKYRRGYEDMPRVLHSVWESPAGKTGYVLINWTDKPEKVTLSLVKKAGKGVLRDGRGEKSLSEKIMRTGKITTTVPARSVLLIEQEYRK